MAMKKKIRKVMLSLPNDRWFTNPDESPFEGCHRHCFPYVFGLLTAVLKGRYEVAILDASHENLSFEQVIQKVKEYGPDVFGISCLTMDHHRKFIKLAELAKIACPDTIVIAGGIYPTLLPELLVKDSNIDYVLLAEGEYRLPRLLGCIENSSDLKAIDGIAYKTEGEEVIQPVVEYIQNLDELPFPDYSNLDFDSYANFASKYSYYLYPRNFPYVITISARGCPFDCIFCTSKAVNGPGIRYLSAKKMLEEVDLLVKNYGIREIIYVDDNFYLNTQRLREFLNGLIERKYDLTWKTTTASCYSLNDELLELIKKSGCYQLPISPESGSDEMLSHLKKPASLTTDKTRAIVRKAKEIGFEVIGYFIIGSPGETWDQIRQTFRFAEDLDIDYCSFNIATPLPKTELYNRLKEKNMLSSDFNFTGLKGFGRATIKTDEFTPNELKILRAFEWDRINFKTEEKMKAIARMNGITMDELKNWRASTRRKFYC